MTNSPFRPADADPTSRSPTGSDPAEARGFLDRHPDVSAIDVVLIDVHGIGRGKTIRRHELPALYAQGRGMPVSLFAQDVAGDDVPEALAVLARSGADRGGDGCAWPVPGTLAPNPATGRGCVLVSLHHETGAPVLAEPRHALAAQVGRSAGLGFHPQGALELEFYLLDAARDPAGRPQPARAPLTGRRLGSTNTMSVDELDEIAPFLDAVYSGAEALGLPLETVISEYAPAQFEFTLGLRPLLRAADDLVLAKRLVRATARRFGLEACFMAKPFGDRSGSGMHLHLSLADAGGTNLFADPPGGGIAPLMGAAIGGVRAAMAETMLVVAPHLNSWRRFARSIYSPASNTWGIEDREVALRVPAGKPAGRHFEHRVAGVDANPYLVAAVTLGTALDGIEAGASPGATGPAGAAEMPPLPGAWGEAIGLFTVSRSMRRILGPDLHGCFAAIASAEHAKLAATVTEIEWDLYGNTV